MFHYCIKLLIRRLILSVPSKYVNLICLEIINLLLLDIWIRAIILNVLHKYHCVKSYLNQLLY